MKSKVLIGILILALGCTSTRYIDSWKKPGIYKLESEKLVVVGITQNILARKLFENALAQELEDRGYNVESGQTHISDVFITEQRSRDEIKTLQEKLVGDGFDKAMITTVVGIEETELHQHEDYSITHHDFYRFGRYYYQVQQMYPEEQSTFKTYHVETAVYNLIDGEEDNLEWVGAFDVVAPDDLNYAVEDYVKRIIKQLKKEDLFIHTY